MSWPHLSFSVLESCRLMMQPLKIIQASPRRDKHPPAWTRAKSVSVMCAFQDTACSFPSCARLRLFTLCASGSAVTYSRFTPWPCNLLVPTPTATRLLSCDVFARTASARKDGPRWRAAREGRTRFPVQVFHRHDDAGCGSLSLNKGLRCEFGKSVPCRAPNSPI